MRIKKREYQKEDLTVIWDMPKCIHSERCWRELGSVFRRNEKPWVNLDGANKEEIMAQLDRCPSGALSYRLEDQINTEAMKITINENGPAILSGSCSITHKDGSIEEREGNTALCRCGASANKPFCDGSHNKTEFKG
jgi:uncharacterized Fe-S cluster protein YjdI